MRFAPKINNGHFGPRLVFFSPWKAQILKRSRKFWHHYLPKLKYHNPAISMTLDRTAAQEDPATMSIHYTSPISSTDPAAPIGSTADPNASQEPPQETTEAQTTERIEQIEMKNKLSTDILAELLKLTKARQVEPTAEELALLTELDHKRHTARRDSTRMIKIRESEKKRQDMLKAARSLTG
jgi:large subunit ribosomal protein MRP49